MRLDWKTTVVIAAIVTVVASGAPLAQTVNEISTENGKISANLKNIQVTEVLKILADKSDFNFVISGGITGAVTLYVEDMEPLELLDVLSEIANIAYERKGNVVKIYSADRYRQIFSQDFVDKRVTQTIALQHVGINAVLQSSQALKSPKGLIMSDPNSNSLIVTDYPDRVQDISNVVAALDVPLEMQVYTLRHTSATKIIELLKPYGSQAGSIQINESTNQVIISETDLNLAEMQSVLQAFDVPSYYETEVFQLRYPHNPNLIKLVEQELAQGVGRTSFDETSNTLIVSSIPEEMTKVRRIVGSVDRGANTILIEAKIIQVSLNDDFKMGVNWQYVNDMLDSLSVTGIFNILVPGDRGVTVLGGSLTDNNYQFMVEALATIGETNLLASPRILALEGEEAKILVGNNVPYTTTDTREDAGGVIRTFEQVTYVDAGVKLVVNAQVNEDRVIVLAVQQEVSNIVGFRNGIPETSKATSETIVAIPNGVTVVMAGLIQEEQRKTVSKVPILGSIPLLGALFRSTSENTVKSELIVFLTPHITIGEATPYELKQLDTFESEKM